MPAKALFAVYTDDVQPARPSNSSSRTIRPRPRRVLESDGLGFDKENGDAPAPALRPKKSATKATPVHFAGKTPFALASPVACSKDAAQQRLGLGMASGNTSLRGPRPAGGRTARTVGLSVGRKRGRQVSEELALEDLAGEVSTDSAIVDEDPDRTLVDLATPRDGALAVVTQAYTGQGAFCYSPTAATVTPSLKHRSSAFSVLASPTLSHRSSVSSLGLADNLGSLQLGEVA